MVEKKKSCRPRGRERRSEAEYSRIYIERDVDRRTERRKRYGEVRTQRREIEEKVDRTHTTESGGED